jgi:Domain of unknown function (DUF4258)
MREARVFAISNHADRRLAQRNLSFDDVRYVFAHGRVHHAGKAMFVHLGLRDIPADDLRDDHIRRLEGTVLVLDPATGQYLTTAYRNRRKGSRDIKRKSKHGLPAGFFGYACERVAGD